MSEVLQQYLQTVLRAAVDRRSLLPLLALLLGCRVLIEDRDGTTVQVVALPLARL